MSIGQAVALVLIVSPVCLIGWFMWGQFSEERRLREMRDEIRSTLKKAEAEGFSRLGSRDK